MADEQKKLKLKGSRSKLGQSCLLFNKSYFEEKDEQSKDVWIGKNQFIKVDHTEKGYSNQLYLRDYDCSITSNECKYFGMLDKTFSRQGLGLYIYNNKDTYFGEWKNNQKSGHGIYVQRPDHNKYNFLAGNFGSKEKSMGEAILVNYDHFSEDIDESRFSAYIGMFDENHNFQSGLILTHLESDQFLIYSGKVNSKGLREDENCVLFNFKDNLLFLGYMLDDHPTEGVIVKLNENFEIEHAYSQKSMSPKLEAMTDYSSFQFKINGFMTSIIDPKKYFQLFYKVKPEVAIEEDIFTTINLYSKFTLEIVQLISSKDEVYRNFDDFGIKNFLTSYLEIVKKNEFDLVTVTNVSLQPADKEKILILGDDDEDSN